MSDLPPLADDGFYVLLAGRAIDGDQAFRELGLDRRRDILVTPGGPTCLEGRRGTPRVIVDRSWAEVDTAFARRVERRIENLRILSAFRPDEHG